MANYSKIKRVVPSRSHLVTAVGENRRVEEWECIGEIRGRIGKLRREVIGRLDEGNVCENKTAQDCHLCLRSVEVSKG